MNTLFRQLNDRSVWTLLVILLAAAPVSQAEQPAGPTVTMRDNVFQPASLLIEAGQTVTWTNGGAVPHSIIADNGSFNSSYLNPGQRFSFSFEQPGTYSYYCDLHQGMDGAIVVTAPLLRPRIYLPLTAASLAPGSP